MNKKFIVSGELIHESTCLSFGEVCCRYNIPEKLLMEMIEHGLFSLQSLDPKKIALDQNALRRIESAFRLHRDLGINLPGVALVLDLLDKLEKTTCELHILRRHF